MLDVKIEGYYQKTDFIVGSRDEVERAQRFVLSEKEKSKNPPGNAPLKK